MNLVNEILKDIKLASDEFEVLVQEFSTTCSETRLMRASERHQLPFQLHFKKSATLLEKFIRQHEELSKILKEEHQILIAEDYNWLSKYKSNIWTIQEIASEYSNRMFNYTHFDQDSPELVINLRSQIDSFVSEVKEVQRKFAELNVATSDFVYQNSKKISKHSIQNITAFLDGNKGLGNRIKSSIVENRFSVIFIFGLIMAIAGNIYCLIFLWNEFNIIGLFLGLIFDPITYFLVPLYLAFARLDFIPLILDYGATLILFKSVTMSLKDDEK